MKKKKSPTKLIVVTGGPGAGKTAVLEMARKAFCEQIAVLPEAASIVFGGGFWRKQTPAAKMAAQRAIYHVQRELERMVIEEGKVDLALCDRGTLDGLAYWPGTESAFFKGIETTREKELRHYCAVIHLRTPTEEIGYNHANPLRIESPAEAAAIDKKIFHCWRGHPNRFIVDGALNFLDKAHRALELIRAEIEREKLLPMHRAL